MKVCFLSWHFATPEIFLDYLRPQSPGCSGTWKDMVAVTDPYEADFIVIFDGYNGKFPKERAIYFCQHPKISSEAYGTGENYGNSFKPYTGVEGLAFFNSDNGLNPGEWWADYTYDQLNALEPPKKTKELACVMTYQTYNAMYSQRLVFMREFVKRNQNLDLYGRPEEKFRADEILSTVFRGSLGVNTPDGQQGNHKTGKNLLIDYKYSLEFDVGPTQNYLSERFYDSLLLWCLPFYFGSTNVNNFLPLGSYVDINILKPDNYVDLVNACIKEDFYERRIKKIAEARDLLLNKYQTWPYVYNILKRYT